ncbi:MAG: hypothetical protein HY321_22045 [Armatimonadetes bacterium]|nr:hypothetical protein [Armatimonadota bacterium]
MKRGEPRASSRWRMVGKGVLVLVVLAAIAHSAAAVMLGRRVEARLEAIRAVGYPVSVGELAGPPVADDQNAAVLYREIFRTLPASGGSFGGQTSDPSAPRPVILAWAPEPSAAAQRDAVVLGDYMDSERRAQEPELYEQARRAVARYPEIPPLAVQAVARPRCRFPMNWDDAAGALFPHLERMHSLARFLAAKAVLDARESRMPEAAQAVTLTFQVSESLRGGPSLIGYLPDQITLYGQLVRVDGVRIGAAALREVSEWGDIAEEDARRLADVLAEIDLHPGFASAIAGERAMGIWAFDVLRREGVGELASPGRHRASALLRLAATYPWRPLLYADQLAYLDLMNRDLAASERRSLREALSEFAAVDQDAQELPRYAVLSRILLPEYGRARMNVERAHAALAGSRALLGLIVYRQRFGAYPESLAELRQRLGWEVPDDPFSEKPLAYRRDGAGFLVYSVGPDMKDDSGRPTEDLRRRIGAGVLLRDRRSGATTPAPEAIKRAAEPGAEPGDDTGAGDFIWRRVRRP